MNKKAEPWYLHAGLWAIIVVLVVIFRVYNLLINSN